MGEAVLGAFLPVLLEKLADQEITEYFGRLKGVDKKVLEKWTRTLRAIEAVLSDAEEKQLTQRAVKDWLDDLRDLSYDLQDVLDIFDTKMLKRRIERQQGNKSKLWSSLSKVKSNFGLNSAIKKISDRLEEITTREKQLGLKKLGVSKKPWKMPPTTYQLDGPVIGRDEAKAKILYDLLSKQENYHVVGIVGTGGLGKTTLAKHVFNDAATGQFSPKGWVSVSDDFDIVRVAAAVLESVTSSPVQEFKELNSILEKLSKELAGKKFLIVLDDVWHTCSYSQWTTLQASFRVGAAGSKIIVTTRDAKVANMMGDRSPYNLNPMSEDECWKLFQHHAQLKNRPEDVEFLKEKIVEKCNGLPLVARTLGGLLRCKEVDEWEDLLDHKMRTLSDQNKKEILPALKLSYHYLPSTLKRCFSYCGILPNDYEFEEMQLILWWMAEGLIPPKEHEQMEDLGRDYFQELVSRSLFQKSSKTESRYIMHDLVTDLARWAAGSSCCRLEDMQNYDSQQHTCLPKVRHSSYILGKYDGVKKFEVYSEATSLRTFLPLSPSYYVHYLAPKVTSDLFPKLQYLRLLSLKSYRITELPDTIGELKHLRYLDLSHTGIRSLPDSTTTLYNLQTLLLKRCHELKALPTSMRNLVNLRHLNNSFTRSLEEMPPQLGQLTNLQTLPEFVIGKGSGSGVREIESLLHLQGTLHISRLENVIRVEDARSANLKSKERLEALFLEWSSSSVSTEDAAIVLDMLQPHSKLKELTIKGYGGLKFSTWIGNPSFTKMVRVKLEGCNHCQLLPPFGQLPCLKELCIQNMNAVESVGVEFYGEGDLPFQALETLELHNLKNWKKWYPCQQSEGVEVFSCLKKLSIKDCSKLEGDLPENLDSLAQLEICGCEELVVSVAKYKQLHGSNIEKCKMVVYDTSTVQFELLESLTFSNVSELRFQTEAFMKSLKNVKELKITGCEELTCCFQNDDRLLQHLISLGRLCIEDNSILVEKLGIEAEQLVQLQILDCNIERLELSKCGSLVKLRIEFCGQLELITDRFLDDSCQLKEIFIVNCPNLKSLPEGLCHLTNLQSLIVHDCQSLVSLPRMNVWPRNLSIGDCEKLEVAQLARDMMHTEKLEIDYFEGLTTTTSFPTNVTSLEINKIKNCKALMESQGLQRLASLRELSLRGEDDGGLVSFPPAAENSKETEILLPRSLVNLRISGFPNLKKLSKGFQFLTSLEIIGISNCPKLTTLPVEEGLPLSQLRIHNCPLLEQRYKGRYRHKIAHIPCVQINYKVI
ncbi:PREDICTED: putative disease resistance protein At3g14460-like [Fragaria vesca subsp. vesca]